MDGNGRMSRLLVSLVLIRAKLLPLLIRVEDKLRYFNALRAADGGDILDLASFIAGMQIQSKLFLLAEKVRTLYVNGYTEANSNDTRVHLRRQHRHT